MQAVIANMPPRWLAERKNSEASQWDEMWSGVLHMPPMPNRIHQNFSRDLMIYLHSWWALPHGNRVHQEVNLTTPEDEPDWTLNYRIPDLVLLTPDRFSIDKGEYMAGAPLVVIEIRSPRDETYEKLPFYAALGIPEVWVFDRDTREPRIYSLTEKAYQLRPLDSQGWILSPATGIEFKHDNSNKLGIRLVGNVSSARELGDN
jgi:Uma2 family endonuclease